MRTMVIERIQRQSRRLYGIVTGGVIVLPLLLVWDIGGVWAGRTALSGCGTSGPALTPDGAALLALFQELPMLAIIAILFIIRQGLADMGRGRIFTADNSRRLSRIGYWLIVLACLNLLVSLGVGPLAAWAAAADPLLSINVEIDVAELLGAALLFLLARIMVLAASLQKDADLTV